MKGCALLAAAAICGCGRLGFDPIADGASGTPGDDAPASTDDASGMGAIDAAMMIDALAPACLTAIQVTTGTPSRSTTCTGFDRIDGCATVGAEEVVFRWVVPASGNYTISSTEVGTGIIRSTGRVNADCTATTTCPGLTQTPFTAGQVLFFVLESQSGCMTYDLLIMAN